jgi:hypothetical protein
LHAMCCNSATRTLVSQGMAEKSQFYLF